MLATLTDWPAPYVCRSLPRRNHRPPASTPPPGGVAAMARLPPPILRYRRARRLHAVLLGVISVQVGGLGLIMLAPADTAHTLSLAVIAAGLLAGIVTAAVYIRAEWRR